MDKLHIALMTELLKIQDQIEDTVIIRDKWVNSQKTILKLKSENDGFCADIDALEQENATLKARIDELEQGD